MAAMFIEWRKKGETGERRVSEWLDAQRRRMYDVGIFMKIVKQWFTTEYNMLQPPNALFPMLVTALGISMLIRAVFPKNASSAMLVTVPSVGILLAPQPAINVLLAFSMRQLVTP